MGRPRKEIDEDQVYNLATRAWTDKDIAYYFKISNDTLVNRFSETLKEARAKRDGSLREKQYEVAMSGNTTMMIWLGKQLLGQRDQLDVTNEVSVKEAIDRGKQYLNGRINGHTQSPASMS